MSQAVHNVLSESFLLKSNKKLFNQLVVVSKSFNVEFSDSNMRVERSDIDLEQDGTENRSLSNTIKQF